MINSTFQLNPKQCKPFENFQVSDLHDLFIFSSMLPMVLAKLPVTEWLQIVLKS
jgi:hypothetical protein